MTSAEIYIQHMVRDQAVIPLQGRRLRKHYDEQRYDGGPGGLHMVLDGLVGTALADDGLGEADMTGSYEVDPRYGSGSIRICLCDNDISLILVDLTLQQPFCLCAHKRGESYVSCFHEVDAYRTVDRAADKTDKYAAFASLCQIRAEKCTLREGCKTDDQTDDWKSGRTVGNACNAVSAVSGGSTGEKAITKGAGASSLTDAFVTDAFVSFQPEPSAALPATALPSAETWTYPLRADMINVTTSRSGIRGTTFKEGSHLCGFMLIINEQEYNAYLQRLLGRDACCFLDTLAAMDQQLESAAVSRIARELFRFHADTVCSRLYFRSKAAEILSCMIAEHPVHRVAPPEQYTNSCKYQENAEIDKVIQYMGSHLSESLTTEELARLFCSSPSRLSSVFRKVTSKSLSEYRNGLRVREAARLLTQTKLTQEEIAQRVGFTRVSNFSDFFRRMTGEAPGALRKGRECCMGTKTGVVDGVKAFAENEEKVEG